MTQTKTKEELVDLSEWRLPEDLSVHRESQIYAHPDGIHLWRMTASRTDWLNSTHGTDLPGRSWKIRCQVHDGTGWVFERNTLVTYEFIEQGSAIESYIIGLMEAAQIETNGGSLAHKK